MGVLDTKDPRNALASWNGYEFQGQIALIVVLEMMITKEFSTEKCELMLEDLEDFSIYVEGERISTHQVKATKGKSIKNYQEALYQMALGLQKNKGETATIAYLHTSNALETKDWDADVKSAIEEFVPETEKKLKKCYSDEIEINAKIEHLKERFREKGSFKKKTNGVWEKVYCLMDDVSEESEISSENLKRAIEEYLNNLDTVDLSKNNILDRIQYYDYCDHINVDRKNTRECIEKLIQEYWGEEMAKIREGDTKRYRYKLQELIHCYVSDNHEGNLDREGIKFSEVEQILDETSLGTREYKILRNKDLFYEKMGEYCEYCEYERGNDSGDCSGCDLGAKKSWLKNLSLNELEQVFHLMSPHINKDLKADSNIVDPMGLSDSYFYTLKNIDVGKIVHNAKIVYQKGRDNCILTDVTIPRDPAARERIGKGLTENHAVEKICSDIIENREFAKERMEIDALIVVNQREEKIRLNEMCKRLTDSVRPEDEWSYLKITEKKDICLWDAERFVSEYQ